MEMQAGMIYPWQKEFGRYLELIYHEQETGRKLPMSPGEIMRVEETGGMVDLETGRIEWLSDEEEAL